MTQSSSKNMDVSATVARVVAVAERRGPLAGRSTVVAFDGPAGAGKTTLAGELADALSSEGGCDIPIVHMDDLYPGWDGLSPAVDLLVRQVLEPLAQGRPVSSPVYDWTRQSFGDPRPLPAAPWIVVEGVGCGSRSCRPYLSAVVWTDAPEETRRTRALRRDGDAFRPYWYRWARQEKELFAREKTWEHADLVLDTGGDSPDGPAGPTSTSAAHSTSRKDLHAQNG
ncbi:Uridine kinase [Austwickia chelonae]|uniref:(d)CMP kinase n=1 Tax=Austwickia chelonae NBRC 105200 TaxID=1184607 RepID=K6V606_9MICO|nr:hypothetical protein [Austwickia chelonae]GAB77658.1 hypothetical protein AUCHE_05_05730 [Austwickia chelonae NBRC 105200]SEW15109.1 Uridine kinase [Austwickia chelonae]